MSKKNSDYFKVYCEVAAQLISREDKDSPAVKSIIRYVVREATNTSSKLPGYDNKLGAQLMSLAAYEQMRNGNFSNLIGEHVVPVSVILKLLDKFPSPNADKVAEIVGHYSKKAVITTHEDKSLRLAGLTNRMPDNWDGKKINARYEVLGIELVKSKYKELKASHK